MKTIQAELQSTTLGPEYAYISKPPAVLGRFIKKLFEIYCRHFLFKLWCPLKVDGQQNLPAGSFIICSNHNSHMDSGVLMAATGKHFKKFGMMAAKDYFFDNATRKYSLNLLMNLIPVNRESNRHTIIEQLAACREFTQNGQRSIIIYPEGTRSLTGRMQPFKRGPAMISVELGLPIVPVYIEGTNNAWPKGKTFMKPKRIRVWIGEPIYPDQYLNHDAGKKSSHFQAYRNLTADLENYVHRLMENNYANWS